MKTNVTLTSVDRYLFGIRIKHRTQPDMLSLTQLQEAYDKIRGENGWKERGLSDILNHQRAPENTERIYYILKERGLINTQFSVFIEMCEKQTLIKVLKKYHLYSTYGRGDNRVVFAHPDVFVLTALELNPMIYAKVVVWLTDNLVYNRINAGDENNLLMSRIRHLWNPDAEYYKHVNRALNYIIFKNHYTGIRNQESSPKLKQLETLQNNYAFLIDTGYIQDKEALLLEMKKEYVKRYMPDHKSLKN